MPEPVRNIKFDGGRYEGRGLPLDSIDELRRLQTLLSSVARELFLREHPDRERVSKKFKESMVLRLVDVDGGSVTPVMERPTESIWALDFSTTDYYEKSIEAIAASIESLESSESLPAEFPEASISDLLQLGRSFRGQEVLKLQHNGSWSSYGRKSRQVLQRLAQVREIESEEVLLGQIHALAATTFSFLPASGGKLLPGAFDESLWDDLKRYLGKDERAPLVSISAVVSQDSDGLAQSISELQSIELALPPDWSTRLQELARLESGWFDGDGAAILESTVTRIEEVLTAALEARLPRPGIFPTPAGELRLEWEFATGGAILETIASGGLRCDLLFDDGREDERVIEDPIDAVEGIREAFPNG